MEKQRENFGSRFAVIMAMAGAAIGLGNIWRFPYMVGEHGGSVFIIVYIFATLLLSLPIFLAEVMIGRRSRRSAYGAWHSLKQNRFWKIAGILPVLIPIIITSYYSVVGGWALDYLVKACQGTFIHTPASQVGSIFAQFTSCKSEVLLTAGIFLAITGVVIAGGVKTGIEKFSKITIPVLFFLVVAIMIYSLSLPGAMEGVRYLIKPDLSQLTPSTFAYAMGQSFYSLSLGMGAIITYGSYVKKNENLLATGVGSASSDVIFAILAAFAIMPAVFAAGIEPGAGPSLIFQSIPYVFVSMGAEIPSISLIISILFFLTIVVAAITSNMCMYEVVVAYLVEEFKIKRTVASIIVFAICGGMGVFSAINGGVFDFFDWLSSNILLTIAGFLSVFFVGWVMTRDSVRDEFTNGGTIRRNVRIFNAVYFLIRWVAPIGMLLIFVTNFVL